jgi:hypothetical protein
MHIRLAGDMLWQIHDRFFLIAPCPLAGMYCLIQVVAAVKIWLPSVRCGILYVVQSEISPILRDIGIHEA